MSDQENVDSEQAAAVNQSADVRDPADDSGLPEDPQALAETYPDAFDGNPAEAVEAIEEERETAHPPKDDSRSTDNDRDRQITPGPVIRL